MRIPNEGENRRGRWKHYAYEDLWISENFPEADANICWWLYRVGQVMWSIWDRDTFLGQFATKVTKDQARGCNPYRVYTLLCVAHLMKAYRIKCVHKP